MPYKRAYLPLQVEQTDIYRLYDPAAASGAAGMFSQYMKDK